MIKLLCFVGSILLNTRRFGTAKRLIQFKLIKTPKLHLDGASGRTLQEHSHLSFPNSGLGMPIGGRDFKELFFNRRCDHVAQYVCVTWSHLQSFKLLNPINYSLSFGSAKPTQKPKKEKK